MEKEEYRKLFELEDRLWWFKGMRDISLALLKRYIPDSRKLAVLDAGCGTGGMLQHLYELGAPVGIDISADALHFAGRRDNRLLANASVSRIPFLDGTFDLVTSFDVVYHRAVADDVEALAEMARVLRPGGTLFIRVPAYDWLRSRHDEAVHTRQRYGRKELEEKLENAGFHLLYMTHANCLLFPIAVAKRVMEKVLTPQTRDSEVEPMAEPWNGLLYRVLRFEAFILRYGKLPFGLSVVALARRQSA
jgi:SAM-dependent methyltransferase